MKLLYKVCEYEMDPGSIVYDTEQTRFCPQTDRLTDGQGETSIHPSTSLSRGYKNMSPYPQTLHQDSIT